MSKDIVIFNRGLATLFAIVTISGSVMAQQHYSLGSSELSLPSGWRQVKRDEDKLVFRSADQRQQATVTVMHFGADPTFESFTKLCQHRIDVEKRDLSDGFIEPDTPKPFKDGDTFGLLYYGGDKKSGRVFSGY